MKSLGVFMDYKRILTIQDISCVGQCSLTVALPILSACGLETGIIPSAILSTHTAFKQGWTFRDLSDDIPLINEHWVKEQIRFDGIYTGYLGNKAHVDMVLNLIKTVNKPTAPVIIDPAMADNGKLYPIFDQEYVDSMARLCAAASVVLPNITEACYLTKTEYRESYDEAYIKDLLNKLIAMGAKSVILTGVGYREGKTGVVSFCNNEYLYYEHEKVGDGCHGTGDVYASAFVGSMLRGKSLYDASVIAADYTLACIKETYKDSAHWYGVKFEPLLPLLINKINS